MHSLSLIHWIFHYHHMPISFNVIQSLVDATALIRLAEARLKHRILPQLISSMIVYRVENNHENLRHQHNKLGKAYLAHISLDAALLLQHFTAKHRNLRSQPRYGLGIHKRAII